MFKVHQLQSSVIRLMALLQIQDIMNESKDIIRMKSQE